MDKKNTENSLSEDQSNDDKITNQLCVIILLGYIVLFYGFYSIFDDDENEIYFLPIVTGIVGYWIPQQQKASKQNSILDTNNSEKKNPIDDIKSTMILHNAIDIVNQKINKLDVTIQGINNSVIDIPTIDDKQNNQWDKQHINDIVIEIPNKKRQGFARSCIDIDAIGNNSPKTMKHTPLKPSTFKRQLKSNNDNMNMSPIGMSFTNAHIKKHKSAENNAVTSTKIISPIDCYDVRE